MMERQPRVIIDLDGIVHNYKILTARARQAGITFCGVLKGTAGDRRIAEALVEAGLNEIGDSRLENLERLDLPHLRRILLRLPALSQVRDTLKQAECSLNSEQDVLKSLDSYGEPHQVILMTDLGDLREGVPATEEDLGRLGAFCANLRHLQVAGLGTNFNCFAGAIPTKEKLERLVELAVFLRTEFNLPIHYVSGGNSSSLPLLYNGAIPRGINHLRIGEGMLLGRETLNGEVLPDLIANAFIIEAEVLQVQWKPGRPDGVIGRDAFGRIPEFPEKDAGFRLLLNIGHQDTPLTGLTPFDPRLRVLGGSSDYMVVAAAEPLKVGAVVRFLPNYWSMLGIMTSPYVEKYYV